MNQVSAVLVRTQGAVTYQQAIAPPYFHEWTSQSGVQWALFYRLASDYLVRFIDLADFAIAENAQQVCVRPAPGVADDVVEHLYCNLVAPLALSHQNKLVLHASAVEIDDFSVAFAAASGGGKSTLAASFAASGYRFLTDDGAQVAELGADFSILPNHPSIRLWADSSEQLTVEGNGFTVVEGPPDKTRILVDEKALFCDEARTLRCVYFLGDSGAGTLSIRALTGAEALVKLLSHSFLLDVAAKRRLARNFENIALLARRPVFFQLDYPRRFSALPAVREQVVRHARSAGVL